MSEPIFKKERGGTFAKRCKHFDGINFTEPEKKCEAGVRMLDVIQLREYRYRYHDDGTVYTSTYSMPCFTDDDPHGVCKCEHQAFPTPEEIEADRREIEELFGRAMKARTAIIEATGGKRGVAGSIACPVCGGELRYSVAGCNGHIHAACTTADCVSWME